MTQTQGRGVAGSPGLAAGGGEGQTVRDGVRAEGTGLGAGRIASRYLEVRRASDALRRPLTDEDCQAQSMPEASPAKWHLAHTTWFFEQFVLGRFVPGYRAHHPQFAFLFNSYYNAVGARHLRPQRGLLTRPTMAEVEEYRESIDERVLELLRGAGGAERGEIEKLVELGLHHEQQHQELLLTDVKHLLWCNPLRPGYGGERSRSADQQFGSGAQERNSRAEEEGWAGFEAGVRWIGHEGAGFAYDNEGPRHRVWLDAFEIATRPVTNGEYLEFMRASGYGEAKWWLDEGWTAVQREGWRAPLYWEERDGAWQHFTLSGMREVALDEPVCHVSFYEADAYARWAGARLVREAEWEVASAGLPVEGNFVESGVLRPAAGGAATGVLQMFGDVWEWTGSAYVGYPGYVPAAGAIGEYNGKFMCNQWVLRGGSCATARSHMRATYRNFFGAGARWQFSGIRLAREAR